MATDSTSASRAPTRPSSSTSEDLFGGLYARGGAAAETTGGAWLQAMLDVEAALARAAAEAGLVSEEAAAAVVGACRAERFDAGAIARDAGAHVSPVLALVAALREAVGDGAAEAVHPGATSQDVVDTAAMLVAHRALAPILDDARGAAAAAGSLAAAHRDTPMAGRTLLQQALPTTFGLRAAGWAVGIGEACDALNDVRRRALAVQMGGPVGTRDPAVATRVAEILGLAEPALPWHAIRVRPAALAGALGTLAGVLGKVARDVTLLAQDEVGEVREGGPGGRSSAMAHKRNPVAAVSVLACATRVPGLVATALATMVQEHERAAGAWQAEWGTLTDLLRLTGSAAAWARTLLEGLHVDAERMAANLAPLLAAGTPADVGAAGPLVDRALAARA